MKLILSLLTITLALSAVAEAAPVSFTKCHSDLSTEVFTSSPDGEGGGPTLSGSTVTQWGSITFDLTVDADKKTASASSIVYTPLHGAAQMMWAKCKMGQDNWMDCKLAKKVKTLGKLDITFNIGGIQANQPNTFYADIFSDADNSPIGAAQTAMDCQAAAQ